MPRDCHYQSHGPLALLSMLAGGAKSSSRSRTWGHHACAQASKLPDKKKPRMQPLLQLSSPWGVEVFHELEPTSYTAGERQLLPGEGTTVWACPVETIAYQILWTGTLRWTNSSQTTKRRVTPLSWEARLYEGSSPRCPYQDLTRIPRSEPLLLLPRIKQVSALGASQSAHTSQLLSWHVQCYNNCCYYSSSSYSTLCVNHGRQADTGIGRVSCYLLWFHSIVWQKPSVGAAPASMPTKTPDPYLVPRMCDFHN